MKYRVIEKPHETFPYDKGDIISAPNDVYEWVGDDKIIRQQRLSNNFCFEEYVEKDYEILLLKSNGSIYNQHSKYFDRELNNPEAEIYSVMRLKDMEVFTVGDRIENGIYIGEITQFEVEDNECKVVVEDAWYCNVGDTDFQHVKKPLFTTEDGVDIYEGDECYSIVNWEPIEHNFDQRSEKGMIASNRIKYFSTKEKAQEYIDLNKPRYSKQDIERALKHSWYYRYGEEKELILNEHNFHKSLNEKV